MRTASAVLIGRGGCAFSQLGGFIAWRGGLLGGIFLGEMAGGFDGLGVRLGFLVLLRR